MLDIGAPAPDFTLVNERNEPVTLSAFRGRNPVVLIFYPADESPGCTAQLCAVRDNFAAFTDAGAVVFGVNPADTRQHQRFIERQGYQFQLLVDRDRSVARQYDALLSLGPLQVIMRTVYVVGTDGTIIFAQRGMPSVAKILAALRLT